MNVYFVGSNSQSDSAIEGRIKDKIPNLRKVDNASTEVLTTQLDPSNEPSYLLFTAPEIDETSLDKMIGIAGRHGPRIFLIIISDNISSIQYKRLLKTGSADWVSISGAPEEILEIIQRRSDLLSPAKSAIPNRPTIISFIPSAGGVGNSKIASEVGVLLKTAKATQNQRICLIDLDFQTSHVCSYLDIEPKFRIWDIEKEPERFDGQLLDILTNRHSSGLDVIAAPRNKGDLREVSVESLDILFDLIMSRYDLIIVDLPTSWFFWTHSIIKNSDALFVVGVNTIPCLHQVVETLSAVRSDENNAVPLSVVINRCKRGLFGAISDKQYVERVLPRERLFFISDGGGAVIDSVNMGTPLVSGNSARKLVKEIGAIARACTEVKLPRKTID